jgi:hypothetical protein
MSFLGLKSGIGLREARVPGNLSCQGKPIPTYIIPYRFSRDIGQITNLSIYLHFMHLTLPLN